MKKGTAQIDFTNTLWYNNKKHTRRYFLKKINIGVLDLVIDL